MWDSTLSFVTYEKQTSAGSAELGMLRSAAGRAAQLPQPASAAPTAFTTQSTVTRPLPLQLNAGHDTSVAFPRAMSAPVTSSSTVTCPLPLQSPTQGLGVAVGEAVGVGVGVGSGVRGTHSEPSLHDAPNTTAHPPHVPPTGAAQKSAHWQQSCIPGALVGVGVTVGVGVGLSATHRPPLSQLAPKTRVQPPHKPSIGRAQLAAH